MSRQSLEMKPYRVGRATFDPAGTGSTKTHRLTIPLRYTGESKATVFEFLTTIGSASVQARFAIDGNEAVKAPKNAGWLTVVGKFTKSVLAAPKRREDESAVVMNFQVLGQDVRSIRELLELLLEAARLEVTDLDATFEIVQPELPMEDEDDRGRAA